MIEVILSVDIIKATGGIVVLILAILVVTFFVDVNLATEENSLRGEENYQAAKKSQRSSRDNLIRPLDGTINTSGSEAIERDVGLFGLYAPAKITILERTTIPDKPFIQVYDQLVAKAEAGDGDAAMQLGLSHALCAQAPKSSQDLESRILQLQTTEIYPETAFRAGNPQEAIQKYVRDFEFCRGMSPETNTDFAYWIKKAAENGQLEALTEFMNAVGVDVATREAANKMLWSAPEEEVAYRVNTLKQAASMGSAWAMGRLSQYARKGMVPELTQIESNALFVASVTVRYAEGQDIEMLMQSANDMLNTVSSSEKDEILRLSQQYLSSRECCFLLARAK